MLKGIYRIFKRILNKLNYYYSINWHKTLYFNFKMFPFEIAKILPVFFYGKVKFKSLKGHIIINAPIKRGMVKFGNNLEVLSQAIGISELKIDGIFLINGSFSAGIDYVIIIQKEGILEIGENSYIGSRTKIISTKRIVLGKYFRFGFESQILDTTFHFMLDYERNEVRRFNGEIIINDYCWVGNRTSIMKNTIIPRYTTIASNSLLNKNYTKEIPERSVIGGIPAKLIRNNISRIYDAQEEAIISKFFYTHAEEQVYKVTPKSSGLD